MTDAALTNVLRQADQLARNGRVDAALVILADWTRVHGEHAEVHALRARFALSRRDHATAKSALTAALALRPAWTEVAINLGRLHLADGAHASALAAFDAGLAHAPNDHRLLDGRRRCLFALGRHREAVDATSDWLAVAPVDIGELVNHASNLSARLRCGEASAMYARIASLDRDYLPALWQSALLVDFVPTSMRDLDDRCKRIDQVLRQFESIADNDPRLLFHAESLVLSATTFGLGLLARDTTALLARIGDQITRFTRLAIGAAAPPAARKSARPRIGLVSPNWHRHTVGNLFRCWPYALDRERFEVCVFQIGDEADACTEALATAVDEWHAGARSLRDWRDTLQAAALDLLIHVDIGLDPHMHALASQRLAPIQAATWGHPQTSGLATIDCFFGADAMEPTHAEAHYRERLIRLPGLGITLAASRLAPPPAAPNVSQAAADSALHLFCPQAASKLHPGHDAVFARILAALPEAVLTLIPSPVEELRETVERRIAAAVTAAGGDPSRQLRVFAHMPGDDYHREMARSTLVLDSMDFSGCATTLDAIAHRRPIVTMRGELMRGHQTAGMLHLLGLDELVCATPEDYVELAIGLARDPARRADISHRIGERAHHLLDDQFASSLNAAILNVLTGG